MTPASPAADAPPDLRGLMEQYGPGLRRYFSKRANPREAEDLVQDVFLAMQQRGALDDVEHLGRYLFRIAANVLARRRARPTWDWGAHLPLDSFDPTEDISPERVLIGKQAIDALVVVLRELPPRTSEAFLMHRFEEMTYAAIAQRMGISVSAVEKLIKRAIDRIADAVEPRA